MQVLNYAETIQTSLTDVKFKMLKEATIAVIFTSYQYDGTTNIYYNDTMVAYNCGSQRDATTVSTIIQVKSGDIIRCHAADAVSQYPNATGISIFEI